MANGTFTCNICGAEFEQRGRGPRRAWCSQDCRLEVNRNRSRKYTYRSRAPESRTCEACGAEFKSAKFRKYCGECPCMEPGCDRPVTTKMRCDSCHSSARQKRKREERDASRTPKLCVMCGAEFQPRATSQKMCSKKCQLRRNRQSDSYRQAQVRYKRKLKENPELRKSVEWAWGTETRICQWCDREFLAKSRRATRFCCQDHYQAHGLWERGKFQSPWSPKWPDVIRRNVPLESAARAIEYAGRDRRSRFAGVTCKGCGDVFLWDYRVGGMAAAWCSDRCQSRSERERRRARKRNAFVENVYRKKVYERDRYRCQICNGRLAMKQEVPHPKAPTIDHIIPLAAGGTHEMRNAQAAHFICNVTKSANAANDQLLLFG